MIKADDKVKYDGMENPEKFTNFEELQKRVELLQEIIDTHADILRNNNLKLKREIEAPYFSEDELYEKLEED